MIRIAVLAKEKLYLDALAGLLDRRGTFNVVLRETTAQSLVAQSKPAQAQLLVVDSQGLDSDEVQFLLGAKAIGEFLVVVIEGDEQTVPANRVDAVVTRNSSSEELFSAIASLETRAPKNAFVREGKRAYRKGNALTRREYEVAELVAKGHSNRKISEVSGLREQSVKNIVSVIMRKLQCENRTQVALKLLHAEVEPPTE